MSQELTVVGKEIGAGLPALFAPDIKTTERVIEFFTAQIRNPNTRKAYCARQEHSRPGAMSMVSASLAWCAPCMWRPISKACRKQIAAPSVKLQLAAIRMLFDWLVVGQVVPVNPASSVRGPKHVVKKGKTPVLYGR